MSFEEYLKCFDEILEGRNTTAPYDNSKYLDYVKMSLKRTQRWLKTGKLNDTLVEKIKNISEKQEWIVITEPWCGDAGHSVPFIYMLSELNPLVNLNIELRDSEPHRINSYLTNGGKSIPKWIVKNESGEDLFTYGPRSVGCQEVYNTADKTNLDTLLEALQKWYNADKGVEMQEELLTYF